MFRLIPILTFISFANMQPTDENRNFVETESLGKLLMDGEYFVAGGSEYLPEDIYVAPRFEGAMRTCPLRPC